jgi:uncharacterized membrane protein
MRRRLATLAGPLFVAAGVLHFLFPATYESIVPAYLPARRRLVLASGVAEAVGGAALLSPRRRVRRVGMWWLLATLVAVFPANVHMAVHPRRWPRVPPAALWARLPFQLVFGWWVVEAARRGD